LKALKDEENEHTVESFYDLMFAMFSELSDYPVVSAEIDVAAVPLVCQEESHAAQGALEAMIAELEGELTFEDWLWEQTQDCCQEVGIMYVKQRKEKSEELVETLAALEPLIASLV
jgi:hypothetical protein